MFQPGRRLLVEHEPEVDVPIGTAVVEAVSSVANCRPGELPVLAETVDPTAMDDLVGSLDPTDEIRFQYAGYLVVVDGDRTIEVYRDR